LALLHAALGIQTPLLPVYDDTEAFGVVDFWAGLKDECWQHFSDPAHFGADFEGIAQLKKDGLVRQSVPQGQLPSGVYSRQPKDLGNRAVDGGGAKKIRQALAVYLERFSSFFSRDFFVRKAFETLNAEVKPEHVGWRKACETLFQDYKSEYGLGEDSLVEHCYRDEYFVDLDVDRVHRFFAWLGVTRHPDMQPSVREFPFQAEAAEAGTGSEQARDLEGGGNQEDRDIASAVAASLAAAEQARGAAEDADLEAAIAASLADHQQAGGALASSSSTSNVQIVDVENRDTGLATVSQEPWVLEASAQILSAVAGAAKSQDPDRRASVFESWAVVEMIHGDRPAGIRLLAKLVAEDAAFAALLRQAVASKSDWLRDTAGLVFRLHGMHADGELGDDCAGVLCLAEAVEVILEPFERKTPVMIFGHFYGALYTQVVVAWLSASQTKTMATAALLKLAKRVGCAIVNCYERLPSKPAMKQVVKERMHPEYPALSSAIWGSRDADAVWRTFFA